MREIYFVELTFQCSFAPSPEGCKFKGEDGDLPEVRQVATLCIPSVRFIVSFPQSTTSHSMVGQTLGLRLAELTVECQPPRTQELTRTTHKLYKRRSARLQA